MALPFPLIWCLVGIGCCGAEVFILSKRSLRYAGLFPGAIAFILALFTWRYGFLADQFQFQLLYWMVLSTTLVIWVRPMLSKSNGYREPLMLEAISLTPILPGQTGRVLYEGTSWAARAESYSEAIAPQQTVYVLEQQGTTLVITALLQSQ